MISLSDLDAPARLQYWPIVPDLIESARWEDARRFPSFRDAIRVAMTEERPEGKAAYVLTQSGFAVRPDQLIEIWSRLQDGNADGR